MPIATYVDANGLIQQAQPNVLRDQHYAGPLGTTSSTGYLRTALLEGAATNDAGWSESFGNWTPVGTTAQVSQTSGALGLGTVSLTEVTAASSGGAYGFYDAAIAFAGNGIKAASIVLAPGNSTRCALHLHDDTLNASRLLANIEWSSGQPVVAYLPVGAYYGAVALGNGAFRLLFATSTDVVAGSAHSFNLYPGYNSPSGLAAAGSVLAGALQLEDSTAPSSYVPTTGAGTASRSADNLLWAFVLAPQAQTLYARFFDYGTICGALGRVAWIGAGDAAAPFLSVDGGGGTPRCYHAEPAGSVFAQAASGPAYGDSVELRAVLRADGAVLVAQSLNGGAEVATGYTAALALTSAWSSGTLYVGGNGPGGAFGFAALVSLKLAAGLRTLAQMRAL